MLCTYNKNRTPCSLCCARFTCGHVQFLKKKKMSVDRLYFSDCPNSTLTMKLMFLLTGHPLTLTLSTPLNCRLVTPKQTLILTPSTERGVERGVGEITLNLEVLKANFLMKFLLGLHQNKKLV